MSSFRSGLFLIHSMTKRSKISKSVAKKLPGKHWLSARKKKNLENIWMNIILYGLKIWTKCGWIWGNQYGKIWIQNDSYGLWWDKIWDNFLVQHPQVWGFPDLFFVRYTEVYRSPLSLGWWQHHEPPFWFTGWFMIEFTSLIVREKLKIRACVYCVF